MNTQELIARLSQEAAVKSPLRSPVLFSAPLMLALVAYGIGVQFFLAPRPDLIAQFARPMFAVEAALLAMLTFISAICAVLAMYPDAYRHGRWLQLPYGTFAALAALLVLQLFISQDARMVLPARVGHAVECTICIAAVSVIPSILIFGLLRKGASVHPFKAGSFAVLAASGLACLTLRLSEANDSLTHLVTWHYLPAVVFATLGALAGRYVLRW